MAAEGIQVYCLTGLDKGQPEIHEFKTRTGAVVKSIFVPFCDRMAELLSASDLVISPRGLRHDCRTHPLRDSRDPGAVSPTPRTTISAPTRYFSNGRAGVWVVDPSQLDTLHEEVVDAIFNDWLLRKFRGNLRRMDRANSLDLMIRDLENLAGASASPSAPTFVPA